MNSTPDIICLTLSRWDAPISSPSVSLSQEFAKNTRVFYIDHPYSWKDYFKKGNAKAVRAKRKALLYGKNVYSHPSSISPAITVITPKLTLPVNFLPAGKLYNWLSRKNDKIITKAIRNVIRDYTIRDFIFI